MSRRGSIEGRICISNENEKKYILPEQLPNFLEQGWVRGNKHDKQKSAHKKWYNNGKRNICINENLPVPEGFSPGMIGHPGTFSKCKYHWYTDGKKSVRIKEGEPIPQGWRPGQSDSHKLLNSTRQKELGNYHCLNKNYTEEYKDFCKNPEKLRQFILENNSLTFEQLAKRFNCSRNAVALLIYSHKFQTLFSWFRECSQPQAEKVIYRR